MTDESFMTDIDIMCKEHEEAMAEKDKLITEKDAKIKELEKMIREFGRQ